MVESLAGKRPTDPDCRRAALVQQRLGQSWGHASRCVAARVKSFTSSGSNFIYLHYAYFVVVPLISSFLLWVVNPHTAPTSTNSNGSGGGLGKHKHLAYVDALFLAVSAQSQTGLNTVDLSALNTFQQAILFALLMLGSHIWVSFVIIRVRMAAFRGRFGNQQQNNHNQHTLAGTCEDSLVKGARSPVTSVGISRFAEIETDVIYSGRRVSSPPSGIDPYHKPDIACQTLASGDGPGLSPEAQVDAPNRGLEIPVSGDNLSRSASTKVRLFPKRGCSHDRKYISTCDEYRALTFLSWIVLAYFVMFQLIGCIGLGWWISSHKPEIPRQNGTDPWWMASFNIVSAFANSGLSLLDKNMIPFQDCYYVLITMALMILAGNTCYPPFLRLIIWSLYHICPEKLSYWSNMRGTLIYLLRNPRRCYTHLYKPRDTWWLILVVAILNGIDWIAFEVLNIGNDAIEQIPLGPRIMDGLFQAIAVRTGGFEVVPLSQIRIGVQVLYVFMMYISAYPIILTMRSTNLEHECSAGVNCAASTKEGIQSESHLAPALKANGDARLQFVKLQLSWLLSHDLWAIGLAIWLITVFETSKISSDPVNFSVFAIVFETVSAYGTVGLSLGYPGKNYSFCGQWDWASKLVLCCIMLKGRHRGVPRWGDWAVGAPHEEVEVEVNSKRGKGSTGDNKC